jgi:phospholipid/cholesterol/gamma-HCH transport system substrate-binding protein/paraquat-inducible protein B
MGRNANYFKIGLFTVAALAALTGGLLYFGLGLALSPALTCDTWFDHSIQGLSEGGAVHFRGIRVGRITVVDIAPETGPSGRRLIRVGFELEPARLTGIPEATVEDARRMIESELANSLRCKLSYSGVSGLGALDLDYLDPGEESDVTTLPNPGRIPIPGARGSMLAMGEAVNSILNSLKEVDFATLNRSLDQTLANLATLSEALSEEMRTISAAVASALERVAESASGIGELAGTVGSQLSGIDLPAASAELTASLREFRLAMARIEELTRSPRSTLPQTMDNLRVMSENFRDLSETAKRYPSQLLFGLPPEEVRRR